MTIDELESEVLKLPPQSRVELAERILKNLDDQGDAEHDRLWREEVERRYRAVQEGTTGLTPVEEALSAIRAELR
jgi:putative addiction module component (TIGR02574 family)